MSVIKDIKLDLRRLKTEFEVGTLMALLANRGIHALINYRISHYLSTIKIPLLPLILTRIIQILYAIDIDFKAKLEGGIVIIHGVGTVIGHGAIVKANTTIYHGVTLGRKKQGAKIPANDGFPVVERNCVLGAGAKIIGPVNIGENCIVGPNCVIMDSLPADTLVKIPSSVYEIKSHQIQITY